ncbi:xanthine dehydrogenase family protein molybdopterin-binding subunit [Actinokineospora globicatena]|uniref:xanthine dehydrogenase family protein molybdopterin-binding subunit n=1 Tax=Actinokineospora globicatena TaxID=103729 RepID=UPI0020A3B7C9|nr:xanthine dehydrogenase family protein molybdopterin-binding subunit [Actinokineospora globicatena]MCP2303657.1 xanthine dehydrogenase, molybdenum binding subunit apoprotein [Actinokineospora globicatena]GLW79206.1 xanthine dehydrogenase [Actinokineospora globicatena]GLW86384.1 xanthine dehydrogenase [Actinokineospora globicatena]
MNAIGQDIPRRDGHAKVTGNATYAYETDVDNAAYCALLQATIAKGHITEIDITDALALPGVLTILTPGDVQKLAHVDNPELAVLQDNHIAYRGQIIGAVIADTSEIARHATELIHLSYHVDDHDSAFTADRDDLHTPKALVTGAPADTTTGDVDTAMRTAPHTIDHTYSTATNHNNPLEPHATTALWQDDTLVLWDSTQGVHAVRTDLAEVLRLRPDQVRVICPYVGGGFGAKGEPHAHVVIAALAARALPCRPVRLALTRAQMFTLVGYRPPTVQHTRLAADDTGALTAIAITSTSPTSAMREYVEHAAAPTRMMYAAPNRATRHRLAALDIAVPTWMRAPGECPGMFGPEVAIDELATALGIDPIDLRVANEPEVDPETGKPFSSRNLVACLRQGADRFGWADRAPRREGDWLVGTGVAAAVFPAFTNRATASIRYERGHYVVEIGAADLGTGAWTVLPQIAADALGVPLHLVDIGIGDTTYPYASVAGGSTGTATWGSAVLVAAETFRDKFGTDPTEGDEAEGSHDTGPFNEHYSTYAFGAQFAEVRVHADTAEIRVPRLLGVFAAGRIINPRTARSQFTGGMTMGLSMALHETSSLDPRFGHVINHDLAEYHIASCADATDVQAYWIDEEDPHVNPLGAKGIGEIGIVGTAAAIVNAAHHATGVRVRDLPLTLDKLLPGLP